VSSCQLIEHSITLESRLLFSQSNHRRELQSNSHFACTWLQSTSSTFSISSRKNWWKHTHSHARVERESSSTFYRKCSSFSSCCVFSHFASINCSLRNGEREFFLVVVVVKKVNKAKWGSRMMKNVQQVGENMKANHVDVKMMMISFERKKLNFLKFWNFLCG
jgi:hypothetical protein